MLQEIANVTIQPKFGGRLVIIPQRYSSCIRHRTYQQFELNKMSWCPNAFKIWKEYLRLFMVSLHNKSEMLL